MAAEAGWRWRTGERILGCGVEEPCAEVRTGATYSSHVMAIATLRWQRGRALTFRVSDGRQEQVPATLTGGTSFN